ncbi:MAG: 3-deoxy-manno-octulosonate cytidylyltransferase [Saprospiraceae bacterium]|nr:3-deoxy-manno-octulosonate cytidylyltransferase [Saprospiraceae bacterium]
MNKFGKKILGVIPARYASTRFPGKPLIDIAGKSMIQRVYERTIQSNLDAVVIATDHESIIEHVKSFGATAISTSENHPSGTDRCQEIAEKIGQDFDYIVNIQGDEPFIFPEQINLLIDICDGKVELSTMMLEVKSHDLLMDDGEVKIVKDIDNQALYFSRQAIPAVKNKPIEEWLKYYTYYRHVGMYVYRKDILSQIAKLPPSSLEIAESLEQLRWLENGFKIKLVETNQDSFCVDTPEDVEWILEKFKHLL